MRTPSWRRSSRGSCANGADASTHDDRCAWRGRVRRLRGFERRRHRRGPRLEERCVHRHGQTRERGERGHRSEHGQIAIQPQPEHGHPNQRRQQRAPVPTVRTRRRGAGHERDDARSDGDERNQEPQHGGPVTRGRIPVATAAVAIASVAAVDEIQTPATPPGATAARGQIATVTARAARIAVAALRAQAASHRRLGMKGAMNLAASTQARSRNAQPMPGAVAPNGTRGQGRTTGPAGMDATRTTEAFVRRDVALVGADGAQYRARGGRWGIRQLRFVAQGSSQATARRLGVSCCGLGSAPIILSARPG